MLKKLALVLSISAAIQGCAQKHMQNEGTDNPLGMISSPKVNEVPELSKLLNQSIKSLDKEIDNANGGGEEALRFQSIKEVGYAAGIYAGRRWRQEQINSWLNDMNSMLATTFNFEQVVIDGLFLPPRVEEIKGHAEKQDDGSIRVIRQGFRIATEAELVVTPPTYLNYLFQKVDEVAPLNRLGLPEMKTDQVNIWQTAVLDGWKLGVKQANMEFNQDLNLLHRDYNGMLLYIDLVNKGIISMPKVNNKSFGVMISGDGKTLNIGDEIYTIGRVPTFQHHQKWESLQEGIEQGAPKQ